MAIKNVFIMRSKSNQAREVNFRYLKNKNKHILIFTKDSVNSLQSTKRISSVIISEITVWNREETFKQFIIYFAFFNLFEIKR
jgi:hypothetical protein